MLPQTKLGKTLTISKIGIFMIKKQTLLLLTLACQALFATKEKYKEKDFKSDEYYQRSINKCRYYKNNINESPLYTESEKKDWVDLTPSKRLEMDLECCTKPERTYKNRQRCTYALRSLGIFTAKTMQDTASRLNKCINLLTTPPEPDVESFKRCTKKAKKSMKQLEDAEDINKKFSTITNEEIELQKFFEKYIDPVFADNLVRRLFNCNPLTAQNNFDKDLQKTSCELAHKDINTILKRHTDNITEEDKKKFNDLKKRFRY